MDAVSLLSSRLPRPHIALLCFSMTAKACIDIDATKKVNRSLTEKRFVHFRLSKGLTQKSAKKRTFGVSPLWFLYILPNGTKFRLFSPPHLRHQG
ncbi:hypothetical protein P9711_15410, partial [Anoxybacillus geothermalis]|nr:hypothetical protein [Anoxybacillus geothermalis]